MKLGNNIRSTADCIVLSTDIISFGMQLKVVNQINTYIELRNISLPIKVSQNLNYEQYKTSKRLY